MAKAATPLVGIIMGSQSDWETMKEAALILDALDVPHETRIVSAHRTPARMAEYAATARERRAEVAKTIEDVLRGRVVHQVAQLHHALLHAHLVALLHA